MPASRPYRRCLAVLPLIWCACASAQPASLSSRAFDIMELSYKPLCTEGDDLAWPMKVEAIASAGDGPAGELKFSTSTRELFYTWAKTACADWLGDSLAFVQCHGDVHLGNTGSYVTDLATARTALGLKDFDETVAMPFQTDLLQALLTLKLQSAADKFDLSDEQLERAARNLLAAYREALTTGRTATDALLPDAELSKLVEPNSKSLRDAAESFLSDGGAGQFRRVVKTKKGAIKEILRPALRDTENPDARYAREDLARALSASAALSPSLAKLCVYRTPEEWAPAIEGAVIRTRLGSGGSQGMIKLFVYVRSAVKLAGGTSDALFYLKEQASSSAAQRASYVPPTPPDADGNAPGGRRVSGGATALTSPELDASGWTNLRGPDGVKSFYVDIYNPWNDEPEVKIKTEDDLQWSARYLGTVLGAAHCKAAGGVDAATRLKSRLTPPLERQLLERVTEFAKLNAAAHRAFLVDPRFPALREKAQAALQAELAKTTK